jgi:hypothetical protein
LRRQIIKLSLRWRYLNNGWSLYDNLIFIHSIHLIMQRNSHMEIYGNLLKYCKINIHIRYGNSVLDLLEGNIISFKHFESKPCLKTFIFKRKIRFGCISAPLIHFLTILFYTYLDAFWKSIVFFIAVKLLGQTWTQL